MVHTRATNFSPLICDPDIDRTVFRLRKEIRNSFRELPFVLSDSDSDSDNMGDGPVDNVAQTLRQLTAPNLQQQPLAVQFPELPAGVNFELKSGLIHLLPQFRGSSGEDPNKHLAEFHAVCSSMKPPAVTEDQIKLRAFPFSLKEAANEWFYYLPPGSIDTWAKMKKVFLEKYFPATRLNSLKKSISNIEQHSSETLYEYYERFKKLISSCPYHGYSNQDLILYLFGGLLDEERRMVNAACGGNILNKTPDKAFELFSELSEGSRQYNKRESSSTVKAVYPSSSSSLQSEVNELKNMMKQFIQSGGKQQVKACEICSDFMHPTNACPTLQEPQEVNAVGGYGPSRPRYDPFSNTYNPRWRDHPNLRYGNSNNQQYNQQGGQPTFRPPFQPRPQGASQNSMTTDEMIRTLAQSMTTM
jgi:hypothetical protein